MEKERVGYRVNAKYNAKRCEKTSSVTVFAERTNELAALGLYGGDAYPAVYERELSNGRKIGFIVVADGVGQGSYSHETLKNYLDGIPGIATFEEKDRARAKLSLFLRKLYGNEIFDDNNRDVLDYALKCFSDVPTDGYYAGDSAVWNDKDNVQRVMPFYERDSQSLGSRIVCVGVYMKFRKYLVAPDKQSIKEFSQPVVKTLREEIEKYIYGELQANVMSMIDHSDAPSNDKRDRYFLPSTIAMWFYILRTDGTLSAVAFNMGDARCYLADVENGVRQISIDDAFPDGSMSAFVHFGQKPQTENGYSDGKLRARVITAKAPCALFACSDGVYDTCPTVKQKDGASLGSLADEPSDFLFEKNMLDGMRRCYSLHDFEREIVFGFYAQASSADCLTEMRDGESFPHVKRDDSGTLAAKFFGSTPTELFDALRQNKTTTLDALFDTAVACKGVLPYAPPHAASQSEREEAQIVDIAGKLMTSEVFEELLVQYQTAFASMKAAQSTALWGIEHDREAPLGGFNLKNFMRARNNKITITTCMLNDWASCGGGIPQDWASHEHVVASQKLYELLEKAGIAQYVEQASESGGSAEDLTLELYGMFEKSFFGEQGENREDIQVWDSEKTKRTVLTVAQVEEAVEKYSRMSEEAKLQAEAKKARRDAENQAVQAQAQAAPQDRPPLETAQTDMNERGEKAREEAYSDLVDMGDAGIINASDEPATTETNNNGDSDK